MSGKRITMRKIREILRLRHEGGLSIRQIKASTKISVGAIQKLLAKADALGLVWPLTPELTDNQLALLFYPRADTRRVRPFPGSGLAAPASGVETQGHDQATAVGGIHRAVSEPLLQLLAVL